jgi:hypothetical protein
MVDNLIARGFINWVVSSEAVQVISEDRARYTNVYSAIESYVHQHKLILSDRGLLAGVVDKLAFNYLIYTSTPDVHARGLADALGKLNNSLVKMRAITINEYAVEYDSRVMATIFRIQSKRGLSMEKLIIPWEHGKLLYLPTEIELMSVYHDLYSVDEFDKFEENTRVEKILFAQLSQRIEVLGAGDCLEAKRTEVENLKQAIVMDFLPRYSGYAMIGQWACHLYSSGMTLEGHREKIQLVIDHSVDQFEDALVDYLSELTKFTVVRREQKLYIPKDFRTLRYTFYIQLPINGSMMEKAIIDVFNCGSFDLIPARRIGDILVGAPAVVCRFLTIDLWTMRLIERLGSVSKVALREFISTCYANIKSMRERPNESTEYIGVYREFAIDKKINNATLSAEEPPYYP